jgi:oligogalacturonide lyase
MMMGAGPFHAWTRRGFLSAIAASRLAAAGQEGRRFASDRVRYADPATEFEVLRLTDPSYSSFLPAYYTHALSRRGSFMIFWSDRTGSPQAFQMNLRNGETRQLTDLAALDGSSLSLLPDERSFVGFDGTALRRTSLSNLRDREIYRIPEGWSKGAGFSISGDGRHAALIETRGETWRLRLIPLGKGDPTTIVEAKAALTDPMPRPKRDAVLYRKAQNSLWLVNYDGEQNRPLKLAAGGIGPALWSPDGRTVLYLNYPEGQFLLNVIREATPDTNADGLVSSTSQFVHFGQNADSSVFVGASGSKAAPYVLILLRVTNIAHLMPAGWLLYSLPTANTFFFKATETENRLFIPCVSINW